MVLNMARLMVLAIVAMVLALSSATGAAHNLADQKGSPLALSATDTARASACAILPDLHKVHPSSEGIA
jgi:hypothetical protein